MSEVVYNKGNTFSEATEFTYYPAIVELEDGFKVGALFTSAQMRDAVKLGELKSSNYPIWYTLFSHLTKIDKDNPNEE